MDVLDELAGFEQVVYFSDETCGLEGVVAVHSTVLGPALGGLRARAYRSRGEMLADVLRLGRGMTHKAAAAGLDLGGGKAVVNCDPAALDESRLRSFGRLVESLGGRYITAEDVGTTVDHIVSVAQETSHVVGLPPEKGGLGDPSPSTAFGVLVSMKAALGREGSDDLSGRTVAIAGVGKVGSALAELLVAEGAVVMAADADDERVARLARDLGVKPVAVEEIHRVEADVFAPCALGGALSAETIPQLRCTAVVGAANNQLETPACAGLLQARGIVYVPDFVANAGGLIQVALEARGGRGDTVRDEVTRLGPRVASILDTADADGTSTHEAAVELAERRLRAAVAPPSFTPRAVR